jgi:hypothetical protein
VKVETQHRGHIGWSVTLVTKRHRYTLWLNRPQLTKFSRRPLAHNDGPEKVQ